MFVFAGKRDVSPLILGQVPLMESKDRYSLGILQSKYDIFCVFSLQNVIFLGCIGEEAAYLEE